MANGELYLKDSDKDSIYFIDANGTERSVRGVLRSNPPSEINGEIYIHSDTPGTEESGEYLYWSHGPGETYRARTTVTALTATNGEIFLDGTFLYIGRNSSAYRVRDPFSNFSDFDDFNDFNNDFNNAPFDDFEDIIPFDDEPAPPFSNGGGGGCFVAGTQVLTTNRGYVPIEDLVMGEEIVSYNNLEDTLTTSTLVYLFVHDGIKDPLHNYGAFPLAEVTYIVGNETKTVQATLSHKFYSAELFVFRPLQDFKVGDEFLTEDGDFSVIEEINILEEQPVVYNLDVELVDNYFVNGILVSNDKAT